MTVVAEAPLALVTGAGSGIGARIAARLRADGFRLAINDVEPERAQTVADELGATAVPADVTDPDAMAAVAQRLGAVAVLVNNAGVADQLRPTAETDVDAWQRVVDVNLRGTFVGCRAFGPAMADAGRGAIVNVSSVLGVRGGRLRTAYGPAKAAVRNLTEALAAEWAPRGVRVNAIAPGYVRTPLLESLVADGSLDSSALEALVPMGRLADPDEIAAAVAFLASDEASYVNGTTLVVDGACTAVLGHTGGGTDGR